MFHRIHARNTPFAENITNGYDRGFELFERCRHGGLGVPWGAVLGGRDGINF